jgi:hypothetical protein
MKTLHRLWQYTGALGIALAGCAEPTPGEAPAADRPTAGQRQAGQAATTEKGEIELLPTEGGIRGRFRLKSAALAFEGLDLGNGDFEVNLELNGMVLGYLGNNDTFYGQYLGYAANGQETMFGDEDRRLIHAFARALGQTLAGDATARSFAANAVYRFADTWAEFGDGADINMTIIQRFDRKKDRSFSICGRKYRWTVGTHDCGDPITGWGEDYSRNQQAHLVGHRGSCQLCWNPDGNGCTNKAFYWVDRNNDRWWRPDDLSPYGHTSEWTYQSDRCVGRCGGDCNGTGERQALTEACLKHDSCRMIGKHSDANPWGCADELSGAALDYTASLSTLNDCEGTGGDPQHLIDWWLREGNPGEVSW